MARRRKSIVSSQGSKDNEQQLFKVEWTQNRWGGHVGKQKKFEAGDLLRPAMLDEVVPEREDYFISRWQRVTVIIYCIKGLVN